MITLIVCEMTNLLTLAYPKKNDNNNKQELTVEITTDHVTEMKQECVKIEEFTVYLNKLRRGQILLFCIQIFSFFLIKFFKIKSDF